MRCDFCTVPYSECVPVYKHVQMCPRCGLVQNEPTSSRVVNTSCDEHQGNLRNGKEFRFPFSIPVLEKLNWSRIHRVLDIGSNRGAFVRWMGANHPAIELVAVEPEERLIDYWGPNVYPARFEEINSHKLGIFDLIFSSHTLEHAQSAREMLIKMRAVTMNGSRVLLEIPNLTTITDPYAVEEFFITKHNYHFGLPVLKKFLHSRGFEIQHDTSDRFNTQLLLYCNGWSEKHFEPRQVDADLTHQQIREYEDTLAQNREALVRVVEQLYALSRDNKIAYWGAGRIFDALVKFGGLETQYVDVLVDRYLHGIVESVHGVPVELPRVLAESDHNVIVILGRTSTDEMVNAAKKFAPVVITFNELLDGVLVS